MALFTYRLTKYVFKQSTTAPLFDVTHTMKTLKTKKFISFCVENQVANLSQESYTSGQLYTYPTTIGTGVVR